MAMRHQAGKNDKKSVEITKEQIRRVVVLGGEYIDALQFAVECYSNLNLIDIHSKNVNSRKKCKRVFLFQ